MKVWIVGAAGMLGSEVVRTLRSESVCFCATDREVDVTDEKAILAYLDTEGCPDWIVNCAAWTAVDAAEQHQDEAFALNAKAPEHLAKVASKHDARLLHVSTDYVFNGTSSTPYAPDAPVAPCSVYGRSKLAGENAIRECLSRHVIIRTAWLYGENGPNFVSTMLRLMRERDEIGVVADQQGSPTYARDLAKVIGMMVMHPNPHFGTWHYTNKGITTWHAFACAIQDAALKSGLLEGACRVKPLTTDQYPTPATRPHYSVLDTRSLENDWDVKIPDWQQSLADYMDAMGSKV